MSSVVSFRSLPEVWVVERDFINCTVRFVDPYDHRFQDLRENIAREIQIVNTVSKEAFNRKLRAYREFEIAINMNAGFTHPTPSTDKRLKFIMAKIVWWDEPGFMAGNYGEYFKEGI